MRSHSFIAIANPNGAYSSISVRLDGSTGPTLLRTSPLAKKPSSCLAWAIYSDSARSARPTTASGCQSSW